MQILSAYFVVLPLRDEGAISLGLSNLPGLFVGSLVLTLIAAPVSTVIFSLPNLSRQKVHIAYAMMSSLYTWCRYSFFSSPCILGVQLMVSLLLVFIAMAHLVFVYEILLHVCKLT